MRANRSLGEPPDFGRASLENHDVVAQLDQRVPRYTSYPTAPHFTPDIGADAYAEWLEALPADAMVSLYLHVPFCAELCLYCGCHTSVVRRYEPVASYVAVLEREIDLVAERIGARRPVVHVHWGGGTPTILTPRDLHTLAERLRARFELQEGAEIAFEIDPRRLSQDHVVALAGIGATRASLGIQDFDLEVQRTVNRIQSFAQTEQVVSWLRNAGIAGLNFDLMYGLPYQTVDKVVRSVEQAVSLRPDRIALFGYAHVPWMKRHQKLLPEAAMPEASERLRQMHAAAAAITAAGYVRIGLDHFARPGDLLARRQAEGRLRRNFQGYTTDAAAALVGLGTSAIGMLPQGYVQNAPRMGDYRDAVLAGRLAAVRGIRVTDEDRVRRAVIERLMCDLAVDLDEVAADHGADPAMFSYDLDRLGELSGLGLVRREQNRIIIDEAGRPFVRSVCAVFDRYLSRGEARYSRAL